jgi:hypothetical protein
VSQIKSQSELYDEFIIELQSQASELTDTNEGSIIDVMAGVTSVAVSEILALNVDLFRKTFFDTANGPEVTGDADELQALAVDHFGSAFARPQAVKATGTLQFSRATDDAGNVTIEAGTIVKTAPNSNGVSQRYEVTAEVLLTGLTINASVRALVAGTDGNALAGKVTIIETTLTDPSIVVTNAANFTGGAAAQSDAQYRETIRNLIETIRGATASAIRASALIVAGVEQATTVEFLQYVKEWDIGGDVEVGDYFAIPRVKLYIADANGDASQTLVDDVSDAVAEVRACGVRVEVVAATAQTQNWTASLTLNSMGPNYATLQSDTSMVVDTMVKYIQDLPISAGFTRAAAKLAIMAIWGPTGTDDLVDFVTSIPAGDVAGVTGQKLVPGTVETI